MNGPSVSDIFQADARRLQHEGTERREGLLASLLEGLRNDPADENVRMRVAWALRKLNRHEEAILLLEEGLAWPGSSPALRHRHIEMLAECNRTREAIAAAQAAILIFPGDILLKIQEALLLPVLYDSAAEIDWFRARFTAGLNRLCEEIQLDGPESRHEALTALGNHTNFYLGYQCRNDCDLQVRYGRLAHRIMDASYPQWSVPLDMPPCPDGEPLRIGYVSARFRDLSATRFFLGWLREHDHTRFQIYTWHAGAKRDSVTDEVSQLSHRFHHFAASSQVSESSPKEVLEKTAESIRASNLHALVFLDIGLEPVMTQLAALRLAPIQCMAWDQPITSGLPTVDYAFSSDLAEPEGAETHYSEQLIRLPAVGVSYRKPAIPWPLLGKSRSDFGLREDSTVYLCCQSVFKFLPDNDDIFAQIASRVRNSQFVFVAMNSMVGADFRKRLERAFTNAGLRVEDHIVVTPQMRHLDYWNLHRVADIFLDTIGWSSGGSVFEAVACRLPVVTLPGDSMRGRQGFAILSQLGVTDTIALDKMGYVDCAVRLATDRLFRDDMVARMARGEAQLYSDPRSTQALEQFFGRAVDLRRAVVEAKPAGGPAADQGVRPTSFRQVH